MTASKDKRRLRRLLDAHRKAVGVLAVVNAADPQWCLDDGLTFEDSHAFWCSLIEPISDLRQEIFDEARRILNLDAYDRNREIHIW